MNTQSLTIDAHEPGTPPGDLAIWFFIFAELLAFGVFFGSYAFARAHHVELFNQSQQLLNRASGAINALVLITSSYFVVRAVAAIKQGLSRQCANWLGAAIALGGVFIVIKLFEFHAKFSAGISLSTNTFYMFYLSLTIFHFMHVILGMVILAFVMAKARSGGYSIEHHTGVETGASYWHMVDLVWVILFPLVYVIR
ncbi:MAG: cytochrome c oxidase subunit 3 family protein [Sulfuricella sp.]|nr:cytochrome c oxidase subunit 3 family protein [Sulfuricella sp.]